MSQLKVDTITDEEGTGAPDFPNGVSVNGESLAGVASQAEAEAGTDNTHVMTPLRVAQSIAENIPADLLTEQDLIDLAEGAAGAPRIDPINAMEHQGQAGAVGSYAFASHTSSTTNYNPGDTISGGSLTYAGMLSNTDYGGTGSGSRNGVGLNTSPALSGTWRCMGYARSTNLSSINNSISLWLRIL
jgi:hypothetical protein